MEFAEKVAVVTGAGSGIGRAYATALSHGGARVALVGRSQAKLEAVARTLAGPTLIISADLATAGSAAAVVGRVVDTWGSPDILMSNAGQYIPGDFVDADLVAVRNMLDVNVYGAIAIVREVLPGMIAAGDGDIVMTSSVSGHQAIFWEPVYSATKHAIQSFTHGVRRQLVGTGVRIGAIAPGVVLNEIWGYGDGDASVEEKVARAEGILSEEVADAAMFMLSRPRHVNIRDLVILPTSQEI